MGMAASKHEAFWEACGFGNTHRVKKMIEEGINVNWVSYTHNSSPIHVASQGKPEIVRMLIEAKCNVHVKDDRGNLALHHAAMKGHADIIQMLLDAGCEINVQEKNGWTALLNAAYWCQPDAIEVLLKNNCDAQLKNKDERTALHEACRSQSEDEEGLARIVQMLVQHGCDLNEKSSDEGEADFTPLMFASYHGHPDAAKVLIDAGCDINAIGTNKWSALHWAADRGHRDVVWVLIEGGIDVLHEGDRGELAVERAKDREIKEIILDAARRKRGQSVETTSTLDTEGSGDEAEETQAEDAAFQNDNSQLSTPVVAPSESYENFIRETAETIAPLAAGDDLTTSQIKTPVNEQSNHSFDNLAEVTQKLCLTDESITPTGEETQSLTVGSIGQLANGNSTSPVSEKCSELDAKNANDQCNDQSNGNILNSNVENSHVNIESHIATMETATA